MLNPGLSLARRVVAVVAATAALGAFGSAEAQTLKTVKDRGQLICGVSNGLPGFSNPDDKGNWSGLDVDLCRAVAVAIFDDPGKVKYVPLNAEQRFKALQSGEIDLLSRNSTWTMSREADFNLSFAAVNYYDGQGFMVRKSANKDSALALDGAKVCVQSGTTTQLNLGDYFRANNIKYQEMPFPNVTETLKAYDSGACDVFTSDVSQLYSERLVLSKPDDHVILPDVISKEPLGPAVRQGDSQWLEIVKWAYFAMLNAEELGVTSKNIDEALKSQKPDVKRLVGSEGNYGERIGLTKDWAARIIRQVGNYAESYDRNVGAGSKLGIPRGLNHLWNEGGIQYAPPIR
ncbi:MAG: amino acid ABC transporter substrate-binding protein [Xanthobacteraceae bacterium]|nr:amino acid ABC transporter substrate-binding protein [Xanthobacteraceae bacterium]